MGHVWRTVLRLALFLPGRDVCIPAVWLLLCQWHHPSVAGLLGVCGHSVGLWWAAAKINTSWTSTFRCIVTTYFGHFLVGADRFMDDVARMIGYHPLPYMKCCWSYITPLVCVVRAVPHLSFLSMFYLSMGNGIFFFFNNSRECSCSTWWTSSL